MTRPIRAFSRHFLLTAFALVTGLASATLCAEPDARAQSLYQEASQRFEADDFAGAIALYDQAIKADPSYLSAWHDRGLAKLKAQDFQGAIQDFNALLQGAKTDDDKTDAYAYRGQARAGLKQFKAAIADLNQAITLCPACGYYYFNRSKIYLETGERDKARADLQEAASRNIDEAQALLDNL